MFFSSMEEEKMVYIMTDCSKNVKINKGFEIEICRAVHEKKTMFLIDWNLRYVLGSEIVQMVEKHVTAALHGDEGSQRQAEHLLHQA